MADVVSLRRASTLLERFTASVMMASTAAASIVMVRFTISVITTLTQAEIYLQEQTRAGRENNLAAFETWGWGITEKIIYG